MPSVSIITRGRDAKFKALAHRFAIMIADQHHDPIAKKYHGVRKKYIKLKEALFHKYRIDSINKARDAVKSLGKAAVISD